ncbi:hypothetical protein [Deinococcus planocerae]|uniref:hypothetical protein n=1 Tax=Deinococcus planocerae TaxID=1737569 RepID=UPI000C7F3F70|nr:hypothetical protein [Deinococcus planocerae]
MTQDDDQNTLPVNPTLAVRLSVSDTDSPAEQGDAPVDFAARPASGVPLPSGEGLSANQVTALLGDVEETRTDTNVALDRAEGLNPDTES